MLMGEGDLGWGYRVRLVIGLQLLGETEYSHGRSEGHLLAKAQIMAKAAKVPARP